MLVHVLADNAAKLSDLCRVLDRRFRIAAERLDVDAKLSHVPHAVVVCADLRLVENISALKKRSARLTNIPKRIFLVEEPSHVCISQAYALGATLALPGNVNQAKLFAALADPANAESALLTGEPQRDHTIEVAATAIGSMFTAASLGEPIDVIGTREAGRTIADRIAERGLTEWLATVRRHHEGTYQHCLLVTGVAIDFGLSLGLRKTDLERLYSAAMFHDIGKANVPLTILDKPGRLDDRERAIIEMHPVAGYDFLKTHKGISSEILDAVRHHHEYLDGSGYPDGLCANSISDIVRLLTISDIFAALMEHRQYKPAMPRTEAYSILSGMEGKLEKDLVVAFKDVALTR